MNLHGVTAIFAGACVFLYAYRTGWLWIAGLTQSLPAWMTRAGLFFTLCFISSGLYVRWSEDAPFRWFHWGLLASLIVADVGLLLLSRKGGKDPT